MERIRSRVRLSSALDKETGSYQYPLTAFIQIGHHFFTETVWGEDIGTKLLYAMEHADRILTGLQRGFNWRDMPAGIVAAVILKLLVWQKQSDAKETPEEESEVWFSQMGRL